MGKESKCGYGAKETIFANVRCKFSMDKEKDSKERKIINSVTIAATERDLVQTHGEGSSQIIQAYKGIRVDGQGTTEVFHGRSLKGISKYKTNPNIRSRIYNNRQVFLLN